MPKWSGWPPIWPDSGLFGFKTKHEAMSIMMIAQAEGKHPATAARDYDVINRKLAKRAEAMMRDFMEGGGKVKWHALTDEIGRRHLHPSAGRRGADQLGHGPRVAGRPQQERELGEVSPPDAAQSHGVGGGPHRLAAGHVWDV